jgi:hypothetical protein
MADNVTLNSGTGGDVIAADDVGGAKHQRVKLEWGADGTVNEVDDAAGKRIPVELSPKSAGGCSIYHAVAAATTNAANIKASAGQIYGITVFNKALYPIYVKLHNTSGTPTAGAGVVRTFGVQAGTQAIYPQPNGIAFGTGIGISITKELADSDTTAIAAGDCVVDVEYK